MQPFTTVKGHAIPLDRADVDTDQIIPAKYLKRIERTGFGEFAFEEWRKDRDFVLNNPAYQDAPILLAGRNFGCGSSREHAPWALEGLGIRAIIAPSFADIFRNNCAKIGILTVVLPQKDVDKLVARAEELPSSELVVDLETRTVASVDGSFTREFQIDDFVRHTLLNGLDDVALTLQEADKIAAYEEARPSFKPVTA